MMDTMRRAIDVYQKEVRFRHLVWSVVARAHQDIPPELADVLRDTGRMDDIHELFLKVAALMLQVIYDNDMELNAQKQAADMYRSAVEKALLNTPTQMFLDEIRQAGK